MFLEVEKHILSFEKQYFNQKIDCCRFIYKYARTLLRDLNFPHKKSTSERRPKKDFLTKSSRLIEKLGFAYNIMCLPGEQEYENENDA